MTYYIIVEMIISKTFTFSAAHKLPWHEGKCKNLHGHNYILTVFLKGSLNKDGILKDYYDISEDVNTLIIRTLDHKYLNDNFENPTAEILALETLAFLSKVDPRYYKIILQETENTTAEVSIDDL